MNGLVLTSTDGSTWTERLAINNSIADDSLRGGIYASNIFVIVGYGNTIITSPDGISWTSRSITGGGDWQGVTYGNGTFVAVGTETSWGDAIVFTSEDGINWTERTPGTTNWLMDVTYGE